MAADENGPIPSESLTTVEAMNDWLFRRQSRFNLFGRKSVFKAQVLTPPKALAVEGASIENAEHVCMIRFTSPHMPHKKFLPDPCELSSAENPGVLRENVTSPNGTTLAGLEILMDKKYGLRPLIKSTVEAAAKRSKELGNG